MDKLKVVDIKHLTEKPKTKGVIKDLERLVITITQSNLVALDKTLYAIKILSTNKKENKKPVYASIANRCSEISERAKLILEELKNINADNLELIREKLITSVRKNNG